MQTRIYLDNAATSWPKPESVYAAIDHTQRLIGSAAGRGGYHHSLEAMRIVDRARAAVADLINASSSDNVVFTFNGTDSLSMAIFGLLQPGDHVVATTAEHNSVLRPLKYLEANQGLRVTFVECDQVGLVSAAAIAAAIEPATRLVCLVHASNVTGTIEPVEQIKRAIDSNGSPRTRFLIDAAQTLGHLRIDVQQLGCDLLAAPGHKGLLGPLGTGVLYMNERSANELRPLRMGGTGSDGSLEFQPTNGPAKFEAGNQNVPGLAGLLAGVKFVRSEAGQQRLEQVKQLGAQLLSGIESIDGLTLQGLTGDPGVDLWSRRLPVFSVSFAGFDCHDAAAVLDANWSLETRAGLHCAPMLHRQMATEVTHGTVRLSIGLFNSPEEIDRCVGALRELTRV